MQEQLRVELLRRIQRGSLSISLLSRQTGFGPSHLSNFLHKRRQLSLAAMDRMLAAQHLVAADLVPARQRFREGSEDESSSAVPLISNSVSIAAALISFDNSARCHASCNHLKRLAVST